VLNNALKTQKKALKGKKYEKMLINAIIIKIRALIIRVAQYHVTLTSQAPTRDGQTIFRG